MKEFDKEGWPLPNTPAWKLLSKDQKASWIRRNVTDVKRAVRDIVAEVNTCSWLRTPSEKKALEEAGEKHGDMLRYVDYKGRNGKDELKHRYIVPKPAEEVRKIKDARNKEVNAEYQQGKEDAVR